MNKVKAVYVGVDGKPVKVWDEKQGVLEPALFDYVIETLEKYAGVR